MEKEEKKKPSFLLQGIYQKIAGIVLIALAAVLFLGGIRLGRLLYGTKVTQEKTKITEALLAGQLKKENELSTVTYFYTNMGKYENSIQVGSTSIPFTKKSFIISYDGKIKAGVDMNKVEVHLDGRVITVTVPEAEILSHEVDEGSVQVYDEKNSVFNGLSVEDVTGFEEDQKSKMEQKAVESGILKEAEENAKEALSGIYQVFLESGEYEEGYSLQFVDQ